MLVVCGVESEGIAMFLQSRWNMSKTWVLAHHSRSILVDSFGAENFPDLDIAQ